MKKTLVAFIITILILMITMTTVQGLGFEVKITPSTANVEQGSSVKLVLSVENLDVGEKGLNTFLSTMEYDKTVFDTATTANIKVLNEWDAPTFNAGNGKILTTKGSFVNTESDVLEVTLTAKPTAKLGNTTVVFKNIEASNSQEDIVADNTSYILNIVGKAADEGNGGETPDKTKPTITVSYKDVANGVQVTLTSNEELKAIDGWTLSADKKQLIRVYTANYSGAITVEDLSGNKSDAITISVQIKPADSGNNGGNTSETTQDTTKPTVTVLYKNVSNGVQVTLTANEELKAIDGWTLSTDKKTLTRLYTANYSGTITVEDLSGNKSDAITVNIQIKPVDSGNNGGNNSETTQDKIKPTATVAYSKATNGTVTVTVKASEEIQSVAGWTLSADKKTLTKLYTANSTGTIIITDLAGNKSEAISIKVDISKENGGTSQNENPSSKLPQAGLESHLILVIALIAIIGTVSFVRYKSMKY